MSGFRYLTRSIEAGFQGDTSTVMLTDPKDERGAPLLVPADDMDALAAAWFAYRMDANQFDAVARLLQTWGETPQGRRYGLRS